MPYLELDDIIFNIVPPMLTSLGFTIEVDSDHIRLISAGCRLIDSID